jgi:NitT/TauT family transport system substrate-binding protein
MVLALLIGVLFTACGPATPVPDQVSVQLKWLHQVQFAGMYVAEQEGYYAEENLDVTLAPLDFEQPVIIDQVLSGKHQFGLVAPEELMVARSEGKPVRAVAVIFRIGADIFLVDPESGIQTPYDFAGHKVAYAPGGAPIIYAAMMTRLGLDRSQVEEEVVSTWDLWECWDIAPVCSNYATNGPVVLHQAGEDFVVIWPGDYGIAWYGDILFTTDQMINEQPDLVERFVRATLQGWLKAVEDPDLAVTATLTYDEELDENFQRDAMQATIPLVDTGDAAIGWMDEVDWQNMQDILVEQGLIASPLDLDTVYTNRFAEGE